jgi:RND family efflux transporter MFP subunit
LEQGAISEGEFDVVEAEEKVVEAGYAAAINAVEEKLSLIGVRRVELELARQRLRDAVILAPFDGSVQNRLVAPGGYLAAGDSVVTLVRSNPIWFRGQIPERYVAKLAVGLPLQVKIESLAAPVDAVVTRISPTLDLSSRSLSFEARLDNADGQFRSGIFATADLVIDPSSKALSIPISAVSRFAGAEKVWKLTDGIARQVEIHTGVRRGDQVEVIDGLADRDAILADAAVGRVARVVPLTLSDVSQAETGIGSAVPAGGSAPAATLTGKPLDTLVGIQAN